MRRIPLIIGNWKMYKTDGEAKAFIEALLPRLGTASAQAALAVPFTALSAAVKAASGSSLLIGAQNMHDAAEGAYTGEISASMLKSLGAQFVLLGHSERRTLFGESNQFINRKMRRAVGEGITPILCIGESEKERNEERTREVLFRQLEECLEGIPAQTPLILAYEPLWAIGTGNPATPEMAQEVHHLCRAWLANKNDLTILYGGSVKPDNIAALCDQPDIDGALVGGAALEVESFVKLIGAS